MREVSTAVRSLLDSSVAESHDTLDIILPLKAGQTEVDRVKYYLAPASGIAYNGNVYLPMVRQIGAIRLSLGRTTDGVEVAIENIYRTFGLSLSDANRRLEGAKVVVRRAFKTGENVWEPVDLLHGVIKQVKINQETVGLSIISDMSRRGSQVASRTLTQRCLWTFRGPECGWTPDQPGDANFCNKALTDPLGCSGHSNQPRFGGVPTLSPSARVIVGYGGGNGWTDINLINLNNHWLNPDYNIHGSGQYVGMYHIWGQQIM